MKYFNEHRRKLTKSFSINGFERQAGADGNEVVLKNTSGVCLKHIETSGNTRQKTYTGKNSFDLLAPYYSGKIGVEKVLKEENSITVWGATGTYQSYNVIIPNWQNLLGKTVTISAEYTKTSNSVQPCIRLFGMNGSTALGKSEATSIEAHGTISATSERVKISGTGIISKLPDLSVYPNAQYCMLIYANRAGTADANEKITYYNIQMEIGESVTDYEPYTGNAFSPSCEYPRKIEGVTVSIDCNGKQADTDIVLHGIDDYCDSLKVDAVGRTVFKREQILFERVSQLLDGRDAEFIVTDMGKAVCIKNLEKHKEGATSYCTHFIENGEGELPCFELAGGDSGGSDLYFYNVEQNSLEEFIEWLNDNNVTVAYVLDNERNESVEARSLLNVATPYGQDCILRVVSEVQPRRLDVIYYALEGETE